MKNYRVGIIVPWMNTTLEDELPGLLAPSIGVHWARMTPAAWPSDSHDESYLASMLNDAVRARRSFTGIALDEIIIACTSLSFAANTHAELTQLSSSEHWTCVRDVLVESWQYKGERPVALFGPYSAATLEAAAASFATAGIKVCNVMPINYDGEIKDITPQTVTEHILQANIPAYAAVIVCCTALYTLAVVAQLKTHGRADLAFISSNLAIADHINRKHSGFRHAHP